MYVATLETKNPTLVETFPSDPYAAATSVPKVISYIYITTYAMCSVCLSFLTAFHKCNRDDASICSTFRTILPLPFMQLVDPIFHEKEKEVTDYTYAKHYKLLRVRNRC